MKGKLEEQSVKQDDVLEGVAYLVQRDKEKDPELARVQGLGDKSLLTSLSQDLLKLCLGIERHVGGLGSKFAKSLLGEPLELMEINGDHGFLTRRTFWLLVRRWREVSLLPDSPAPFTLQHLQHVCSSLDPDPTTVQAITASHEKMLERRFVYLSEQLEFGDIYGYFRESLTEEAWEFLTDESLKSRLQKTDRLLAVVYSLGEQGYRLLRDVMEPSGHAHVRPIFPQDDSGPDDVMARTEPDTSEAETVADAGPDDDPNLTTAVPVHDDADDDGHDVQGDDQALALQDEDRRPATAQELQGLLGTVAGILQDTSRRQEERDQTTATRIDQLQLGVNELRQSMEERTHETNERTDRQMSALETRLTETTGAVRSELSERLNAVEERHALDMAGLRDGVAEMQRESRERLGEQIAGLGERLAEDRRMRENMMDHMQRMAECMERSSEKASVEAARAEERRTDSMKAHVKAETELVRTEMAAGLSDVDSKLDHVKNVIQKCFDNISEDVRVRLPKSSEEEK